MVTLTQKQIEALRALQNMPHGRANIYQIGVALGHQSFQMASRVGGKVAGILWELGLISPVNYGSWLKPGDLLYSLTDAGRAALAARKTEGE